MKDKKCVLILPYFGNFNNYFPLFLRSCGENPDFDWLIFTDCQKQYNYPNNVRRIMMTLEQVKETAERKFGFSVCLNSAYKLCDYKPAYGFLFEEYIGEYKYWGHCDCDLIFGKMSKFLDELFEDGYDKIFAAGHLTLYKNDYDNNRRFMKEYKGRFIYREAFTTDLIYVLDEDMKDNNVHRIFLADGASVYQTDLSMNPSPQFARFRRAYYNPEMCCFSYEAVKNARYYWNDGRIIEYNYIDGIIKKTEYIYMHFQLRKMRVGKNVLTSKYFEILPDRFTKSSGIPKDKKEMRLWSIKFTYLRKFDIWEKKIRNKMDYVVKKVKQRIN